MWGDHGRVCGGGESTGALALALMEKAPPLVHIHYRRPPNRLDIFHQYLLCDKADVKVTFVPSLEREESLQLGDRIILENGSPVVWFTFPGEWHDVGRFHDQAGNFTGLYANILTPPTFHEGGVWHTTDLYLDIWMEPTGELTILDEEQLEEAQSSGWIDSDLGQAARAEVQRIMNAATRGDWPHPAVEIWTLERARQALADYCSPGR